MNYDMEKLQIVKIGGNVIDNEDLLDQFLTDFANINEPKILIHGGGKLATRVAKKLNVPQKMIDGRRVTNKATLDIITMVYGGLINKKIVAKLQAINCDAIGLTGVDANCVKAEKRKNVEVDFGFVGDIKAGGVNEHRISQLIEMGITPVFSAITHDGKGNLLNTNADTMASKIAISMVDQYDSQLTFCFEKKGVLLDVNDENSLLETINPVEYNKLIDSKKISEGMIPKLDSAFDALINGVETVKICHAEELNSTGTALMKDSVFFIK